MTPNKPLPERIKFRGRRVDNGEWVEGSLIRNYFSKHAAGVTYIAPKQRLWQQRAGDFNGVILHEVDPATVEQIGGLEDYVKKEEVRKALDNGDKEVEAQMSFDKGYCVLESELEALLQDNTNNPTK